MIASCVIPTAVVPVVVLGNAVSVIVTVGEPPFCPAAERFVYFFKICLIGKTVFFHHPFKCPAMNRRFTEVPDNNFVVYMVRKCSVFILMIKQNHQLVPCQLWVVFCQGHCSEAVVPTID